MEKRIFEVYTPLLHSFKLLASVKPVKLKVIFINFRVIEMLIKLKFYKKNVSEFD